MFSKEEAKNLTTLFWTSFGKYMKKHTVQFGKGKKWVNYKTGVKAVYFRMRADKRTSSISIDIQHQDEGIRELYYAQFEELKRVFTDLAGEWTWEKRIYNEYGHPISKIYVEIDGVNIFNKDTWQTSFQFFEKYIVPLDEFWESFNEVIKQLED